MPWYYAGPEAKPVGPLSVEELQARRLHGAVTPETYVIEHTGQPVENLAWKRFRYVFPTSPVLPPLPVIPPLTPPAPVPPIPPTPTAPTAAQPHPLFPSAAPTGAAPSVFPPTHRPDPYYQIKPTNPWCAWGLALGLLGFIFSFACGIGLFLSLPSLLLCIVGLVQVHKNREQSGQGLAIAGLILSGIALVIAFIIILAFAIPMIKAHGLTVTEQTSNDSE
jgi:hypothetical protein